MEQVLLKEEVIKFKKGLISRREIIPPLTNLILNSLKCYNIKNKEIIHDFYLLILSNLEKILNDYDEERFKEFESWFKKVIKRKFLNFITRENRIFTLALERTEYVEIEDLLDNNCKYGIDYITLFNNLNLSRLSDKEREILRLKLGFTSDKEVVDFITEKIQRIKEIEDTLSFKYVKLLKIHYDILKTVREEDKNRLKEIEKSVKNTKRKIENLLESFSVLPTDEIVGKKLGLSATTVSVFMNRIRDKLRKTNNFYELREKVYN